MCFGAGHEQTRLGRAIRRVRSRPRVPDVAQFAQKSIDTSAPGDKNRWRKQQRRQRVAIHLTPTELAEEVDMKRREVISKCMEMGVPIFNGRIDKTLFLSSLRRFTQQPKQPQTAA
jgi:hypothetical protein